MTDGLHRLDVGGRTAWFDVRSGLPELVYFGVMTEIPSVYHFDRVVPPAGLDQPATPTLLALGSLGWFGEPGLVATRAGRSVPVSFPPVTVDHRETEILFHTTDAAAGISVVVHARANGSGVLALASEVTNQGEDPLGIEALNVTFPIPDVLDDLVTFGGRHAMEFCEERRSWGRSVVTVASRRGRSSHQQAPTVFFVGQSTDEAHGQALGVHLGHSGNYRIVSDAVTGDQRTVTAGEILMPGEVILQPGGTYETPTVLVAASGNGLTELTSAFHRHFRLTSPSGRTPRPVIVNTWEAVYFDHRSERLFELAERAARVGAERFVLDDGWFRGRRGDKAGLGDWTVDKNVWPNGLHPLVEHVGSLGMDFGIWVEPEMVNTDSDLYRKHPDWVLGTTEQHSLTGRNQLVLDLSRDEVRDHLVETLSDLLSSHEIAHVKWDHNRELVSDRTHLQTKGTHEVLRRLRQAHPEVDFESCASGGGRIDGDMARQTVRFWTSDSIDALDRLSIQKGAVRVFPPEMLGAHVGAPRCHTTGRHHHLGFRALSALPYWFGIEWNLLEATDHELNELADVVTLHKRFRHLFHTGNTVFDDQVDALTHRHAVIAPDLGEALVVAASLGNGPRHTSPALRIPGLAPTAQYRSELVHVGREPRWALNRGVPRWLSEGVVSSGAGLAEIGLPMPPLLPASGILVHVRRTSS